MARSLLNHTPVRQALSIGLGVFAVALVFGLLIYGGGGGNTATANDTPPPDASPPSVATSNNESTNTPTPTPELHATPEACPDTDDNPLKTAEIVSEGRHAIFEVYWSSATVNLTANPCPPSVIHLEGTATPAPTPTPDPDATATPTPVPTNGGSSENEEDEDEDEPDPTPTPVMVKYTIRAASNINLDTTVLHVPETVKQTRPADETTDSSYKDKYPFLYKDTDNDGVVDTALDGTGEFWALPYCDPDYNDFEWQSGDMCMGFSTALLHEHHFLNRAGGTPPGKITWELESKREPGIDQNDKGQVYLFLPHDLPEVTRTENRVEQVTWNSLHLEKNTLVADPETYTHRQWGFTKPGTYELSVHAWGYPASALGTGAVQTATSVPRIYTFHVGLLADLGLTLSVDDSAPDPGDTVIYTIKASSKGPDKAENTKVKVKLPDGLTYSSATTSTGTYDSATGVWDVGDMDKPAAGETATTETLTLTVTVPTSATRGTALDTVVEIYATEDIGQTSHVRELDPHTHDNKKTISVTPASDDNVEPYFYIIREIAENSAAGTKVGGPIGLKDADGDTLTYALTGTGKDNFTVSKVTGGLQLAVASGVYLNYEDTAYYDLELTVSDGKDAYGNPDVKTDDTIPVRVNVTDDTSETLTVTLSGTPTTQVPGEDVAFTITITENPGTTQLASYTLYGRNDTSDGKSADLQTTTLQSQSFTRTYNSEATRYYSVRVTTVDSGGTTYGPASTNAVTVTWDTD